MKKEVKGAFEAYLERIAATTLQGDAREESYYPHLKELLEAVGPLLGFPVQVTVLPKRTEGGSPDFRIWDGAYQVIGYLEAKAPGTPLDFVETTEQLERYRSTFPNLILTDFYEMRLYRNGVLLERAQLARPFIAQKLKIKPPAEQIEALERLLHNFFSFALPPSLTPEALSRELARRTRFLRDHVLLPELKEQLSQQKGDLYGFYQAFQKYLIAGLTPEAFADLYAQTLAYGLFAARTRVPPSPASSERKVFNRKLAHSLIPSTIGILRDVFQFISLGTPSAQMEILVDDIAAVLNAADIQAIWEQYYRQGKGDDPILHFYETFLAEYDPETRERRGVYYTPQPVVSYIIRAVQELLQKGFGLAEGLADPRVTLLDPAAGTLTFLAEAIRVAFATFVSTYGAGGKANLLRNHILPHFYAFELLMAPYAIGHMKIAFLLEALGVPLQDGERFQSYLTNALEMEDLQQIAIPGLASLAEESHLAARVKKEEPILVIVGNPPYSGSSANQNPWTETLLKTDLDGAQSYYTVDGQPLREKNPKWLQDDYVKFLRFAQWKIHRAGRGIVAMITNHSYLDNPTFRGMRQSLLRTFDEIYILDLHGNSLKRETAPDGSPDENVFDIRQGVAIGIFVKYGEKPKGDQRQYQGQTPAAGWRQLGPQARELRKNPTLAEDALWQRLRNGQLGVKFRRQHRIDRFIVDFYAREPHLIIEVDGPIHETQQEYDAWRQSTLEGMGYRVLRFTNDEVLEKIEEVIRVIRGAIGPHPLSPSLQREEGNAPSQPTARREKGGVYHAHLYGSRKDKYRWLETHDLHTTGYKSLAPQAPFYFFVPREIKGFEDYLTWPRISEIFPINGTGVITARDRFVIDFDLQNLRTRIYNFKHSRLDDANLHTAFGIPVKKGWDIRKAWQQLQTLNDETLTEYIQHIAYRPFDIRFIFYHDAVVWTPAKRVMHHLLAGENMAIIAPKQHKYDFGAFVSITIGGHKTVAAFDINYYFPLYLYPSGELLEPTWGDRRPNLAEWLLPALSNAYGLTPTPEAVLAYLYAVFYSPPYREKYAQELRTDFPRVPFPTEAALFQQMTALGQELIDLHLLRKTPPPCVKYQGNGSDTIEFVRYDPASERVFINKDKYFEGIPPKLWEYRIGGYQVLEKWLKDRKGQMHWDFLHYIRMATAIAYTIELQEKLKVLYPQVEEATLSFRSTGAGAMVSSSGRGESAA